MKKVHVAESKVRKKKDLLFSKKKKKGDIGKNNKNYNQN